MPRKGISKTDVISSIHTLIEKGKVPTAAEVRVCLGRGSLTTIQKHFRAWKMDSFKNCCEEKEKLPAEHKMLVKESIEEIRTLQKRVLQVEEHNKALSQELIKKEQENLKLNRENIQLTQNLEELTKEYKSLCIKFEDLTASHEDLKKERETVLQKILDDKNKHIERLTVELKEINEAHLNAIKDVGQRGDEFLIQEKVKSIHFVDKVNELQQQVKILEEKLEKEEKMKEPLQREVKKQQALIQQFITWEQLQTFDQQYSG